ncbi:MAG: phosphopyruvate hydratase, partial [Gemmatimonadetes bacterium]|nr:phosphopyruvate hydratase [Gemmatimonadota bacterium]
MSAIEDVRAREVLDSRGNPTVYCEVVLADGARGEACVPSGASTGTREAVELRDGDSRRYGGRGVSRAVANVNGEIRQRVRGFDAADQRGVDTAMVELDGSRNKGRLGANAVLAVSLAVLRACAAARGLQVYERVAELDIGARPGELPVPMFNILNGGAHAAGSTDFQEFMAAPVGLSS